MLLNDRHKKDENSVIALQRRASWSSMESSTRPLKLSKATSWRQTSNSHSCRAAITPLANGALRKTAAMDHGLNHSQVTVYNNIPADWPLVSEGISVHWHGFSMNGVPWYDGVGYLAQCPIKPGANFTYRFQVSELTAPIPVAYLLLASTPAKGNLVSSQGLFHVA